MLPDVRHYAGCLIAGVSYLVFDQYVGGVRTVNGPSMIPTLNTELEPPTVVLNKEYWNKWRGGRDYVFFTRLNKTYSRGDVVLLDHPKAGTKLVKRVVGLPGDQVRPLGVNNTVREPVTVPTNCLWLESDAGFGYRDSSVFGPVDQELVWGTVKKAVRQGNVLNRNCWRDIPAQLPDSAKDRLIIPKAE